MRCKSHEWINGLEYFDCDERVVAINHWDKIIAIYEWRQPKRVYNYSARRAKRLRRLFEDQNV